MNFWKRLRKVYRKLILIKKLAWFALNFVALMAPFKQMSKLMGRIYLRVMDISQKILKLANQKDVFYFLKNVEGQAYTIMISAVIVIAYLYLKFFRNKPKSDKDKSKPVERKQLDQLSQKTIVPQTKMIRQEKQEVDSCCEQLHNGLAPKPARQDRVFLAILQRYQSMQAQKEEDSAQNDRQMSKNNNKLTLDNSTDEGNLKTSLRGIPITPTNKKEIDDLNRSSVF